MRYPVMVLLEEGHGHTSGLGKGHGRDGYSGLAAGMVA